MLRAVWNGVVIAESDATVRLEGNYYFPPGSVNRAYLAPSDRTTVCPWKGRAHYYDVTVDGYVNAAAAWYYRHPSMAARQIRGYVAFWHGVRVEADARGVSASGRHRVAGWLRGLAGSRSGRLQAGSARMPVAEQARVHARAGGVAALVVLAWLALSWWHPRVTYHFGPPLAAVAWPVTVRALSGGPAGWRTALAAAAGGVGLAVAGVAVAAGLHWLAGPTLAGRGGVPAEELILIAAAVAWAARVMLRDRPAWFLRAEPRMPDGRRG
ncbi:MAG TPA: DUF427 domain-containing protein [Streptosporangiaceae bacterium]